MINGLSLNATSASLGGLRKLIGQNIAITFGTFGGGSSAPAGAMGFGGNGLMGVASDLNTQALNLIA
ncbi:MAG: hypothetical protein AB7P76_09945 [Candidatus Melainabacteria bacterium]